MKISPRKLLTTGLPLTALAISFSAITSNNLLFAADATDNAKQEKALATTKNEIVLASELEWTSLNPARGDKAPQAGTLWGDRGANVPSGFILKFADGFSSPPHIHNITYRGVVISGSLHNDDPAAEKMWMPAGSYWTQPLGEVHITAAKGESNMAFLEIDSGPYLVLPSDQASDNGERPLNMHTDNIVWLSSTDSSWLSAPGAQLTYTWGSPQSGNLYGSLLKIPAGFSGEIKTNGSHFRAVVIAGQLQLQLTGSDTETELVTGSYFGSAKGATHKISTVEPATLYIRSNGSYNLSPSK